MIYRHHAGVPGEFGLDLPSRARQSLWWSRGLWLERDLPRKEASHPGAGARLPGEERKRGTSLVSRHRRMRGRSETFPAVGMAALLPLTPGGQAGGRSMTCLVARHARHADLSEPPLVDVCRWDHSSTPEGDGPPVVDVGAEGGVLGHVIMLEILFSCWFSKLSLSELYHHERPSLPLEHFPPACRRRRRKHKPRAHSVFPRRRSGRNRRACERARVCFTTTFRHDGRAGPK